MSRPAARTASQEAGQQTAAASREMRVQAGRHPGGRVSRAGCSHHGRGSRVVGAQRPRLDAQDTRQQAQRTQRARRERLQVLQGRVGQHRQLHVVEREGGRLRGSQGTAACRPASPRSPPCDAAAARKRPPRRPAAVSPSLTAHAAISASMRSASARSGSASAVGDGASASRAVATSPHSTALRASDSPDRGPASGPSEPPEEEPSAAGSSSLPTCTPAGKRGGEERGGLGGGGRCAAAAAAGRLEHRLEHRSAPAGSAAVAEHVVLAEGDPGPCLEVLAQHRVVAHAVRNAVGAGALGSRSRSGRGCLPPLPQVNAQGPPAAL
jgi:hypothetical protein